jgi:hypothetical protein
MTLCSYCENAEATHAYGSQSLCEDHYRFFSEVDRLETDLTTFLNLHIRSWIQKQIKAGVPDVILENALASY